MKRQILAGIGAALGLGALTGCDDRYGINMDGTALYCVRTMAVYPGNSDLGIFVDAELYRTERGELRKMGIRAYGDSVTEFGATSLDQNWNTARAHFSYISPHNLTVGLVDEVVVFAVNDRGNEAEFVFGRVDCGTLDAMLR